ncbi:MAG: T9SS type A sorting domain-containing protein [Chitinophagaceae bacterium]|nr:MAG: T9SS type A sorting domain-containing protein [Chitinophagaceae bacterium]
MHTFAIAFESAQHVQVRVRIFDMAGRQISEDVLEKSGLKQFQFGTNLPAGVYNAVISQGSETKTLRVIKR